MALYKDRFLISLEKYYRKMSFEEAQDRISAYMSEPELPDSLRSYHDRMLTDAVKRNPKARLYVKEKIRTYLLQEAIKVDNFSLEEAVQKLYEDMYGLGAIEVLVEDPKVQEISVNGPNNIWYEKDGLLFFAEGIRFSSEDKLLQVIDRLLQYTSREVNRQDTFAQSTLSDGSRIYVAVPPTAKVPYINYRKFTVFEANEETYLNNGTFTEEVLEFFKIMVRYRTNILIIGPQSTGKTTLLSFLTDYYPENFRIGVLESPEFETNIENRRPKGNVFSLKADKNKGILETDIFKHALRFSAKVLVVPEARGAEVEELIKAFRRGNKGSISTLHSLSPEEVVDDITFMMTETGKNYQPYLLKRMVAKSLDIVITMFHFQDGSRKIVEISEVDYDDQSQNITVVPLFEWSINGLKRTNYTLSDELARSLLFHGADKKKLKEMGLIGSEI